MVVKMTMNPKGSPAPRARQRLFEVVPIGGKGHGCVALRSIRPSKDWQLTLTILTSAGPSQCSKLATCM